MEVERVLRTYRVHNAISKAVDGDRTGIGLLTVIYLEHNLTSRVLKIGLIIS